MKYTEIDKYQNRVLLLARAMHRIVSNPKFEQAFDASTTEERIAVFGFVKSGNRDAIIKWIQDKFADDYSAYSIRKLREVGREFGIPYCSRKDKQTLLSEIVSYEQRRLADSNTAPDGGDSLRATKALS